MIGMEPHTGWRVFDKFFYRLKYIHCKFSLNREPPSSGYNFYGASRRLESVDFTGEFRKMVSFCDEAD
jgi:hypothetical protein